MDALEREGVRSEENIFFFVPHKIALTRYSSPVACPHIMLEYKAIKMAMADKKIAVLMCYDRFLSPRNGFILSCVNACQYN